VIIGYARVSSADQNLVRQVNELVEFIFIGNFPIF